MIAKGEAQMQSFSIQPGSCQISDHTKFHMVKGIDNAFDHMELCLILQEAVF